MKETWKIGELAKQTGLTVRTLHHYDKIGLFHPSFTTEAGHRLYSEDDLKHLHKIVLFKQLGFSLEEINKIMKDPDFDPLELLLLQLKRLDEEIELRQTLKGKLTDIFQLLRSHQKVTSDQFISTIQMMKISYSGHFTQEQVNEMKRNLKLLNPDELRENEDEGQKLLANFRMEMEKGTSADNPIVLKLAQEWKKRISALFGDFQGISRSAESYYIEHPNQAAEFGMDAKLYQYIRKALEGGMI
jgi:DNA-binding transcriptional MerR regulator